MFKLYVWKIPFLIIIAFLGWIIVFPSHLQEIAEIYSEYRVQKEGANRSADTMLPPPPEIIIESFCDDRFQKNLMAKVSPGYGCTSMNCPAETPCCNGCLITGWRVEGTNYVLSSKLEPFVKCSIDGCGVIKNCPAYFFIGDLRKACSKK